MHELTWRTGCTFTILVLLVLLGSGRLINGPNPAAAPLPAGEGMPAAGWGAGPSTPHAGDALPAGRGEASPPGITADQVRLATLVLPVPR